MDAPFRSLRRAGARPPLPVVVVVCDDSKTAVGYFSALKPLVRGKLTLRVVGCPSGGGGVRRILARATGEARAERMTRAGDGRDFVWALIDREHEPAKQREADDAKKFPKIKNAGIALSNPCYEVWTLLHLVDTGSHFTDCKAVAGAIKRPWQERFGVPFDNKAQADYSMLLPLRSDAMMRARHRREANDPSWTEVYLVLETIDSLLASPPSDRS